MKAVFVDIETNGLDIYNHVPMEVAVVILDLNDYSNMTTYAACIQLNALDWIASDEEALSVNGFTPLNHDPLCESWIVVSHNLEKFLIENDIVNGNAFFVCQNPGFDKPFFNHIISSKRMRALNMPYHWLDLASMYWIKYYGSFQPIPTPHCIIPEFACVIDLSKDAIAKHLGLQPEHKPHRALNGAIHLMQCYKELACHTRHSK